MSRIIIALLCCSAFICAQEKKEVDNPQYVSWKDYKAGTSITLESVTEFSGNKTVMLMTYTLKKVTKEKVVVALNTTMKVAGQEIKQPEQTQEWPAKIKMAVPAGKDEPKEMPGVKIEKGKETLELAGRKIECEWIKTTTETNGQKTVATVWNSKKIPGGMVKTEASLPGNGKTTMKLTKFSEPKKKDEPKPAK